ncbi:MAG: three component ABC system middle component [Kiritimatiellia bacterium]
MNPWGRRTTEEANLLNPAFGCIVLSAATHGYQSIEGRGMAYPLAYTILPLILHRITRDALPSTARTPMAIWLQEHSDAKVQFFERVLALKPHTRESILFGANQKWLGLVRSTLVFSGAENAIDRALRRLDDEAKECVGKARIVGKWFATVGTTETSMHLWGIRP